LLAEQIIEYHTTKTIPSAHLSPYLIAFRVVSWLD